MPAVFDLDDIIVQLRTSWGGDAENATFPLYSNTFYYALLTSAPNDSSPENAGWQALTSLMEARAAEAFELWDDLIPRNLIQYLGSPPADAPVIQFAYSSTTDKGGTYEYPVTGYYLGTNEFGGQSWEINRAEIWLNSGWSTHSTSSAINQTGYGYYGGYGRGYAYDRGYRDDRVYRGDRGYYLDRGYARRCNDGTTGTVLGAIAGGLLGRTIDTRGDRTLGTVLGAGAGALAGRAVERSDRPGYCR